MAGKSSVVRVAIVGDNSSLTRSLKDSQSKLLRAGKAIAKYGLIAGGIAAVGIVKMTEAAVDDAKAQAILAQTLKTTTGASKKQVAQVEAWITAQGKLLGVTDDDLRPALGKLVAATGDITEAQKLASLAMNVSVGRGKDLGTVVEALAKAQNGSLGGLSRLGVKTKDAAGNTKTLDEITSELAKTYAGAASKAANTAAGKFERVKVQLGETAEDIGANLLPVVNELGGWLVDTGIPAMEDFANAAGKKLRPEMQKLRDWFTNNKDELRDLGEQIVDTAIPAAEKLAGWIADLVGWFSKLPGPVERFGIEVGIAALVLPKLSTALTGMNLSTMIGQLGTAGGKMKLLGQAAKTAAGAAGLGLLIESTHETNDGLSALEEIGGGAGLGAMFGGPWGALIGGTFGALHAAYKIIFGDVDTADEKMADGKGAVEDYAATLDTVTGAYTSATRAAILNAAANSGALTQAALYGVTSRELVNAVLGQGDAYNVVNDKLDKGTGLIVAYTGALGDQHSLTVDTQKQADKLSQSLIAQGNTIDSVRESTQDLASRKGVLDFIGKQTSAWKSASKETRAQIKASQDLSAVYKAFPKSVATKIDATGIAPTLAGIAKVAAKYDATPKQITSLIKATGTDLTLAQVQHVIDKLNATPKQKDIYVTTHLITVHGSNKPALGPQGEQTTKRTALPFVPTPREQSAATAKANLYGDKVGHAVADGAAQGAAKGAGKLAQSLFGNIAHTAQLTADEIRAGLGKASDYVDKIVSKRIKDDKQAAKRSKAILDDLAKRYRLLRANAKAQEQNNAALDTAKGIAKAFHDYADGIRASFEGIGDLTQLGRGDNGKVSLTKLLAELRKRRDDAQEFQRLVAQLAAQGLSQTTIEQLTAQGPEAALATVRAIVGGGQTAVDEIAGLEAQISAAGGSLGQTLADKFDVGGNHLGTVAADALVTTLQGHQKDLNATAEKMAHALARQLAADLADVKATGGGKQGKQPKGDGKGGGGGDDSSNKQTVNVKLTAQQVGQIQRGREIQLDLDAYRSAGGRSRT